MHNLSVIETDHKLRLQVSSALRGWVEVTSKVNRYDARSPSLQEAARS